MDITPVYPSANNSQLQSTYTVVNKAVYGTVSLAASPTPDLSEPHKAPVRTIAGHTYRPGPSSDCFIDGQTLKPGGPPSTASGVDFTLAPSAEGLRSGGTTITQSSPRPQSSTFSLIGGTFYSEDPALNFAVGSRTLVPGGGLVTIEHTPYALISDLLGHGLTISSRTSYLFPTRTNAAWPVYTTRQTQLWEPDARAVTINNSDLFSVTLDLSSEGPSVFRLQCIF